MQCVQAKMIETCFEMHEIDGSNPCSGAISRLTPKTQRRQTIRTGAVTHQLHQPVQYFACGLRVMQKPTGQPATQSRVANPPEAALRQNRDDMRAVA